MMSFRENRTKRKLLAGETVSGVMIPVDAPRLIELCGIVGFDYVVIDAEHGPIDVAACENLIRAAELTGITPVVRVPSHDPKVILRYLDAGAQGIMAPQVNSRADAERVVAAAKYAPEGGRGLGPCRAAVYGQHRPLSEYALHSNNEMLVIAQLEHVAALDELDAILAVPGIDAFELGTTDLSQSLGFPGESGRPEVQSVVQEITRRIMEAGRVLGDTANDEDSVTEYKKRGYKMINCSFMTVAAKALRKLEEAMQ